MCDRIVGLKEVHLETVNIFHYSQKHLGYVFLYTKLTSTVYCFSENYVSNFPPPPPPKRCFVFLLGFVFATKILLL